MLKFGKEYGLPGGFAKHRETPEKAMERELQEETGLRIKKSRIIYKDTKKSKTTFVFEIQDFEGKLKNSWEGKPVKINVLQLPEKIRKDHKKYIEQWLKNKGI